MSRSGTWPPCRPLLSVRYRSVVIGDEEYDSDASAFTATCSPAAGPDSPHSGGATGRRAGEFIIDSGATHHIVRSLDPHQCPTPSCRQTRAGDTCRSVIRPPSRPASGYAAPRSSPLAEVARRPESIAQPHLGAKHSGALHLELSQQRRDLSPRWQPGPCPYGQTQAEPLHHPGK
jgi:hypothetical protein